MREEQIKLLKGLAGQGMLDISTPDREESIEYRQGYVDGQIHLARKWLKMLAEERDNEAQ